MGKKDLAKTTPKKEKTRKREANKRSTASHLELQRKYRTLFFLEETRPRVETEGMTLPQPPEGTGQKRRFSKKYGKVDGQKGP